jgi:hypothetical protein
VAKAIGYFRLAGERAAARGAMVEGERHYARALELIGALLEDSERDRSELQLLLAAGARLIALKGRARHRQSAVTSAHWSFVNGWKTPGTASRVVWIVGHVFPARLLGPMCLPTSFCVEGRFHASSLAERCLSAEPSHHRARRPSTGLLAPR